MYERLKILDLFIDYSVELYKRVRLGFCFCSNFPVLYRQLNQRCILLCYALNLYSVVFTSVFWVTFLFAEMDKNFML